jgi:hypothetical protein
MAAKSERLDCDGLVRANNSYTTYGECWVAIPR